MIFLYYKIYAYLIHKKNSIKKYKKNIKCNNSFLRNINLILINYFSFNINNYYFYYLYNFILFYTEKL